MNPFGHHGKPVCTANTIISTILKRGQTCPAGPDTNGTSRRVPPPPPPPQQPVWPSAAAARALRGPRAAPGSGCTDTHRELPGGTSVASREGALHVHGGHCAGQSQGVFRRGAVAWLIDRGALGAWLLGRALKRTPGGNPLVAPPVQWAMVRGQPSGKDGSGLRSWGLGPAEARGVGGACVTAWETHRTACAAGHCPRHSRLDEVMALPPRPVDNRQQQSVTLPANRQPPQLSAEYKPSAADKPPLTGGSAGGLVQSSTWGEGGFRLGTMSTGRISSHVQFWCRVIRHRKGKFREGKISSHPQPWVPCGQSVVSNFGTRKF